MNIYEFAEFLYKKSNLNIDQEKEVKEKEVEIEKDSNNENEKIKDKDYYIEKLNEFLNEKNKKLKNNNFDLCDFSEEYKNNSNNLFCCQALKKKERLKKVKEIFELNKQILQKKYEYCNLYVKNLHKNTTEETFREMFSKFGPLRSCKLLQKKFRVSLFDRNESTFLYGFVCFENEKDALRAKRAWNKSLINASFKKPLYVDYHQLKREREIILRNKRINFINRLENSKKYFALFDNINVHNPDIHQKILTPETRISFSYKSPICNLLQNYNGAYSIINKEVFADSKNIYGNIEDNNYNNKRED